MPPKVELSTWSTSSSEKILSRLRMPYSVVYQPGLKLTTLKASVVLSRSIKALSSFKALFAMYKLIKASIFVLKSEL